jgi:O-antigen/teichoic acid export membrane protein
MPGRAAAGRVVGAVVAQGTTAGASLLVQVAAARSLGASGYGSFTILLGVLIVLAAVQGGWVGDTRVVLDRSDDVIRGALAASQAGFTLAAGVVAFGGALLLGTIGVTGAAVVGLVAALWVIEDAGRRLFIARGEFWKLAGNDLAYAAVAGGTLVAYRLLGHQLTLTAFIASMGAGAGGAVLLAVMQLPRYELRGGPCTVRGLRAVASFGLWRSAHSVMRPLTSVALRVIVALGASRAALGGLEAARLAVAPTLVVTGGVATFLFPQYAREARAGTRPRWLGGAAGAMVAVTVAYGCIVTLAADRITPLLTDGRFPLDRTAVAGWALVAVAFAGGLPPGTALLVRRRSREVFQLRVVDAAVGLASALGFVLVGAVTMAPTGLAIGTALGAVLLWTRVDREPWSEPP